MVCRLRRSALAWQPGEHSRDGIPRNRSLTGASASHEARNRRGDYISRTGLSGQQGLGVPHCNASTILDSIRLNS